MTRAALERLASDIGQALRRADEAEKAGLYNKAYSIITEASRSVQMRLESAAGSSWEQSRHNHLNDTAGEES